MSWVRSANPVVMQPIVDALLRALTTVPGGPIMATGKCHLFTNDMQVTRNTPLSAFTEATFAGYPSGGLAMPTFSVPVNADSNNLAVHCEADFVGGAVVSPGEVIYGYYITDGTGVTLWLAERFVVPQAIAAPEDFLSLDVVMPEPFSRVVAG